MTIYNDWRLQQQVDGLVASGVGSSPATSSSGTQWVIKGANPATTLSGNTWSIQGDTLTLGNTKVPYAFDSLITLDFSVTNSGNAIVNGTLLPNLGAEPSLTFRSYGIWFRYPIGETYYMQASGAALINYFAFEPPYNELLTTTATYSGINVTDGAAQISLHDTASSLGNLNFNKSTTNDPRMWRVDAYCSNPQYLCGYVDNVSSYATSSGTHYNINVVNGCRSVTRNWRKSGSAWNNAGVKWQIYPRYFDQDDVARGLTVMFWYSPYDFANTGTLFGKVVSISSDTVLFSGVIFRWTGSVWRMDEYWGGYSDIGSVGEVGKWTHFTFVRNYDYSRVYVNAELVLSRGGYQSSTMYGRYHIGGNSALNGTGLPAGTKIALPRIWRGDLSEKEIFQIYHHDRKLMGLNLNP